MKNDMMAGLKEAAMRRKKKMATKRPVSEEAEAMPDDEGAEKQPMMPGHGQPHGVAVTIALGGHPPQQGGHPFGNRGKKKE